jgi:hypothetical protein
MLQVDTKGHHCHHLWTLVAIYFHYQGMLFIQFRDTGPETTIESVESAVPVYWGLNLFTLLMKERILSGSFRKPSG